MNTDYIKEIYSNYLTVKDSIKVTRKSISKEISILYSSTIFEDSEIDEVNQKLQSAGQELADLIVLGLFASFERQLRGEILDKSSKLQEIVPKALGQRLNAMAQKEIERWRVNDIIDLFDFAVDGNTRGKLKQILRYRNWIAHGKNPDMLSSIPSTDPKTAYETIMEFITQIETQELEPLDKFEIQDITYRKL